MTKMTLFAPTGLFELRELLLICDCSNTDTITKKLQHDEEKPHARFNVRNTAFTLPAPSENEMHNKK